MSTSTLAFRAYQHELGSSPNIAFYPLQHTFVGGQPVAPQPLSNFNPAAVAAILGGGTNNTAANGASTPRTPLDAPTAPAGGNTSNASGSSSHGSSSNPHATRRPPQPPMMVEELCNQQLATPTLKPAAGPQPSSMFASNSGSAPNSPALLPSMLPAPLTLSRGFADSTPLVDEMPEASASQSPRSASSHTSEIRRPGENASAATLFAGRTQPEGTASVFFGQLSGTIGIAALKGLIEILLTHAVKYNIIQISQELASRIPQCLKHAKFICGKHETESQCAFAYVDPDFEKPLLALHKQALCDLSGIWLPVNKDGAGELEAVTHAKQRQRDREAPVGIPAHGGVIRIKSQTAPSSLMVIQRPKEPRPQQNFTQGGNDRRGKSFQPSLHSPPPPPFPMAALPAGIPPPGGIIFPSYVPVPGGMPAYLTSTTGLFPAPQTFPHQPGEGVNSYFIVNEAGAAVAQPLMNAWNPHHHPPYVMFGVPGSQPIQIVNVLPQAGGFGPPPSGKHLGS